MKYLLLIILTGLICLVIVHNSIVYFYADIKIHLNLKQAIMDKNTGLISDENVTNLSLLDTNETVTNSPLYGPNFLPGEYGNSTNQQTLQQVGELVNSTNKFMQPWEQDYSANHPTRVCHRAERAAYLETMCAGKQSTFSDTLGEIRRRRFFMVDNDNKILLCFSGKAGATNFKTLLVYFSRKYKSRYQGKIVPFDEPQSVHHRWYRFRNLKLLKRQSDEEMKHILDTYYKVITVRHPFSRFVSFYNDKLADNASECNRYQRSLGNNLLAIYRQNLTAEEEECARTVTFHEWIDHFSRGKYMDQHLQPFTERCLPCDIKYDHVVKIETAEVDEVKILEDVYKFKDKDSAKEFLQYLPTHSHSSTNPLQSTANVQSFTKVNERFTNINESYINYMLTKYRKDLKLFGYKVDINEGKFVASCDQGDKYGNCC